MERSPRSLMTSSSIPRGDSTAEAAEPGVRGRGVVGTAKRARPLTPGAAAGPKGTAVVIMT
ncbi:hypothetical protein AAIH32_16905 [Pseudarthrobacter oxydans]|uniref:hypothetical protein n=1 Tax=Pseudarthrobacter oxydans TaxID=1671 RepID=UPI003D2C9F35